MKRFGDFRPHDSVISSDNLLNLHIAVSSVAELNAKPNNTIAVFTQDSGVYRSGDVVINRGDGKGWVTLQSTLPRLGPVTNLRGYRMNKRVYLKWKDPSNIYDNSGAKKCSWHHDVVIRKYGAAPQNILDGTVVRMIYDKDRYGAAGPRYLTDYVPDADNASKWYYRVFSVADNGIINYANSAPAITLSDMPWTEIIGLVREGKASSVFNVGDSWLFDDGNEMVVADISKTEPYRVTMLLKYSRYDLPFDVAKGQYFLTKDVKVDSKKSYYTKSGDSFVKADYYSGTPIDGSDALDGNLYEQHAVDTNRATNGSNRWSVSDLRFWMNNIHTFNNSPVKIRPCIYDYLANIFGITTEIFVANKATYISNLPSVASLDEDIFNNAGPLPPYFYLKRYCPEILDVIVSTSNKTYMPTCDGRKMETTEDYFFIPSITEVTGLSNNGNLEGKRFGVFSEGILDGSFGHLYYDEDNSDYAYTGPRSAFTRSANLLADRNGFEVLDSTGNSMKLTAKDSRGVIIAFNIG